MAQAGKRGVFLRNTKCIFATISCFSETREERQSRKWERPNLGWAKTEI
jgi:hypothetical protein